MSLYIIDLIRDFTGMKIRSRVDDFFLPQKKINIIRKIVVANTVLLLLYFNRIVHFELRYAECFYFTASGNQTGISFPLNHLGQGEKGCVKGLTVGGEGGVKSL